MPPSPDDIVLKVLQHVETMFQTHEDSDARRWERFDHRLEELTRSIVAYMDKQSDLLKAIPGEDVDGHRRYHEAVIKRMEERAEFWATMRKEIGKYGLIGLLGWLVVIAWNAFLHGPAGK